MQNDIDIYENTVYVLPIIFMLPPYNIQPTTSKHLTLASANAAPVLLFPRKIPRRIESTIHR